MHIRQTHTYVCVNTYIVLDTVLKWIHKAQFFRYLGQVYRMNTDYKSTKFSIQIFTAFWNKRIWYIFSKKICKINSVVFSIPDEPSNTRMFLQGRNTPGS